jgi:AraC-like DNA-binding protein
MCLSLQIAARQHLLELTLLRRVRDRIDREYARPLDVEALARDVEMTAGHLSRRFRLAYGCSPHGYQELARAVRNREARAAEPAVA